MDGYRVAGQFISVKGAAMPSDLSFLFVGLFALVLLVALLVWLGRGGDRKVPPPKSKHRKRTRTS